MKERPIIFSTEMVRAILDLKKTMTRRVIKPQPIYYEHGAWFEWERTKRDLNGTYLAVNMPNYCPYGQVGDRLWVRETWYVGRGYDNTKPSDLPIPKYSGITIKKGYIADGSKPDWAGITRSPLFIPRWASRIDLEITDIRVERLQKINLTNIYAEGCPLEKASVFTDPAEGYELKGQATEWFAFLWDSLNAKRGYGWETNPFVWVISFRRLQC